METIGILSSSIHRDGSSAGEPSNWVTFRDAKLQIRSLIREAGLEAQGFFRPRSSNRGELLVHVQGGTVSASRKPGADVVFTRLITRNTSDLSRDELAAIVAQG